MVNIMHHSFIVPVQTNLHLLRISTSFIEESEERSSFWWQIISCSLIGLLIIADRNFRRFSDCGFVSAFELIFIVKLDRL